jgi:hypothetical protein
MSSKSHGKAGTCTCICICVLQPVYHRKIERLH